MKESALRAAADCAICRQPFGHTGLPLFWRVSIVRYGVDLSAMRRQDGLTAMLGGHARLAQVMGANDDLAKPVGDAVTITVCEDCGTDRKLSIAALAERTP